MIPLCLLARTIRAFGRGWDRAIGWLYDYHMALIPLGMIWVMSACVGTAILGWWGVLILPALVLAIALLCYVIRLISRLRRWADRKTAQCDDSSP